jgi:nicotinamide mononucleotide transporter
VERRHLWTALWLGLGSAAFAIALRAVFAGPVESNLAELRAADWAAVNLRLWAQEGWSEVVGFAFGVAGVFLAARGHVANYPVGIVNVLTYAYVFWHARLYADMGLQIVFFVMLVHGWWSWLHGGVGRSPLPVTRASPRSLWILAGLVAAGMAVLSPLIAAVGGARPLVDTFVAVASLAAQWLLNRKHIQNWPVWIGVNVVAVPLFLSRGLVPTAALYVLFLMLAVVGWRDWGRRMNEEGA